MLPSTAKANVEFANEELTRVHKELAAARGELKYLNQTHQDTKEATRKIVALTAKLELKRENSFQANLLFREARKGLI